MAKVNFRLDTIKLKATRERLYSGKLKVAKEIPNGLFAFLGDYVVGESEIRNLETPTAALLKAEIPVLIHNPEINYKQDSKTDGALGAYRNRSGKVLRVFPLNKYDEISLSDDFFDTTGKPVIAIGDIYAIQENMEAGTQLKYSATAPADNKVYLKVTGITNSHIPVFLGGDGAMFPSAYKMVDVEIIFA